MKRVELWVKQIIRAGAAILIINEICAAEQPGPAAVLDKQYLLFPIRTGAPSVRVALQIEGKAVREFDAELGSADDATFWAPLDVAVFRGKQAILSIGENDNGFDRVRQSDKLPQTPDLYDERMRPQFHFSQRVGWNNDPNGLVHYDDEWHLFFQHNPYGWNWGNMHWGHAVSRDLIHWQELPIAIYNHHHGDWAFSGSAVVDEKNTAGWQQGKDKVIVVAYTSTGRGECIAYSNDRGRTFVEYDGNPVVQHAGRDPKLIWYQPRQHWVMAVYDGETKDKQAIAFYTSSDLKKWTLGSKLPGYFECPEIFKLPVDGNADVTRWVVYAADAKYALGSFDGRVFTPDHEGKHQLHHGAYYASQTFDNAPRGRRIQFGWAKIDMPGMPFNQTFSFPHELSLRTTPDGVRLFAEPISEVAKLYKKTSSLAEQKLTASKPVALSANGELFDIRAVFDVGAASEVGLDIDGNTVTYDTAARKLEGAALEPINGRIIVQVLVDRPMLEVCGNSGRVVITSPRRKLGHVEQVIAFAKGGEARLVSLDVHQLNSIWNEQKAGR